jgi:hypothetical protein
VVTVPLQFGLHPACVEETKLSVGFDVIVTTNVSATEGQTPEATIVLYTLYVPGVLANKLIVPVADNDNPPPDDV